MVKGRSEAGRPMLERGAERWRHYNGQAVITLSYDDGRLNNWTNAAPLHAQYDVVASFAIIADRATRPDQWGAHVSPWHISQLAEAGHEVASHSVTHRDKLTELPTEELDRELTHSRDLLQGMVPPDTRVNAFCVPFSRHNYEVIERSQQYYRFVRVHGGRMNDVARPENPVWSYGLKNHTRFEDVQSLINEAIDSQSWLVLMLHGVVDKNPGTYDIVTELLAEILSYIDQLGRQEILPLTFSDVAKLQDSGEVDLEFSPGEISNRLKRSSGASKSDGTPITLADDDGYLITRYAGGVRSDVLLISFGGLTSGRARKGFGTAFALARGYEHIYVAQEGGTQYQKLSLDRFLDVIEPYAKGKRVVTYGSSLGGYCALYYGGALDAQIIANGPKNSAHPYMRKKKYELVEFTHSMFDEVPKTSKSPILIYDPHRSEETNFIQDVIAPNYPNARHMRFEFAGHTVLNTMKEAGVLKDVMISLIEKDQAPAVELPVGSYIWHAERGRSLLADGDAQGGEESLIKSLEIKFNRDAAGYLIRELSRQKRHEEVSALAARGVEELGSGIFMPRAMRRRLGYDEV